MQVQLTYIESIVHAGFLPIQLGSDRLVCDQLSHRLLACHMGLLNCKDLCIHSLCMQNYHLDSLGHVHILLWELKKRENTL